MLKYLSLQCYVSYSAIQKKGDVMGSLREALLKAKLAEATVHPQPSSQVTVEGLENFDFVADFLTRTVYVTDSCKYDGSLL